MVLKLKETSIRDTNSSCTLIKLNVPKPELHLLVCINSREHLPEPKLSHCASPDFSKEYLKELKLWLRE